MKVDLGDMCLTMIGARSCKLFQLLATDSERLLNVLHSTAGLQFLELVAIAGSSDGAILNGKGRSSLTGILPRRT